MRETANYILVGIATALIIYLVSPSILSTKVEIVEVNSANNTESSDLRTSYSDTFNKVKSSVVTIYTERNVPQRNHSLTIDPQTGQPVEFFITGRGKVGQELDFELYELSVEASKLMQGEYLDDLPGLPEGDGESGDARRGSSKMAPMPQVQRFRHSLLLRRRGLPPCR